MFRFFSHLTASEVITLGIDFRSEFIKVSTAALNKGIDITLSQSNRFAPVHPSSHPGNHQTIMDKSHSQGSRFSRRFCKAFQYCLNRETVLMIR
jgi:hypothetical protein